MHKIIFFFIIVFINKLFALELKQIDLAGFHRGPSSPSNICIAKVLLEGFDHETHLKPTIIAN